MPLDMARCVVLVGLALSMTLLPPPEYNITHIVHRPDWYGTKGHVMTRYALWHGMKAHAMPRSALRHDGPARARLARRHNSGDSEEEEAEMGGASMVVAGIQAISCSSSSSALASPRCHRTHPNLPLLGVGLACHRRVVPVHPGLLLLAISTAEPCWA